MTALPAAVETVRTLPDVATAARDYAQASKAPATWKAYRSDWRDFTSWCECHGRQPLPASPETVALYLAALAERLKPATLQRRIASISQAHQAQGHETPTKSAEVRFTWSGIRRTVGTAQRQADPATIDVLRAMVDALDDERLIGVRDRAMLLLGFAGAFRRSELVSLDVADVTVVAEGLRVTLRRAKNDQEGAGQTVAVPYGSRPDTCPVRAVAAWLKVAGIEAGPIFRPVTRHGRIGAQRLSDRAVAEVVRRTAERAGLDGDWSGHSLRSGFATSAGAAGVQERHIARQTRHKSLEVLRRYIRDGDVWRDNAAASVGL